MQRTAAGYRNTPNDAALILVVSLHVEVTVVSNGEYVGRHLSNLPVGVEANVVRSVDGKQLVRIYCHQDRACVCLQGRRSEKVI